MANLLNQPDFLTADDRTRVIDQLMPLFESAYEETGGQFPGEQAIRDEYAFGHDLELIEMADDFLPEGYLL